MSNRQLDEDRPRRSGAASRSLSKCGPRCGGEIRDVASTAVRGSGARNAPRLEANQRVRSLWEWGLRRGCQRDEVAGEFRGACGAEQFQRSGVVVAQKGQQMVDAGLAAGHERVQIRTPEKHRTSAERDGNRNVGAGPDAAVEVDLGAVADRVDDTGKQLERGHGSIQLASAVVRDRDAVRS